MIRAILTDIEGTTSSISFVKDVLFPYAREHMAAFVLGNRDLPAVRQALDETDAEVGELLNIDQAIAQLQHWIDEDRKVTPLKALQGLIWESGYANGDFHGHMYADAVLELRKWQQAGLALYVYSSGSVHAQKLLFAHTDHGDLTALFSGYFDTLIGAKNQAESYRRVQAAIGVPANEILFLSDVAAELDAAHSAGMQTRQLLRDATSVPSSHPAATTFEAIQPT